MDIYVDCASTAVRVAGLDVNVERGWSLSKTGDKWTLDVRAITILDDRHTTLTSTSEFFLRAAARIDRKLAARFLPGDVRVALRRAVRAAMCWRTASDAPRLGERAID